MRLIIVIVLLIFTSCENSKKVNNSKDNSTTERQNQQIKSLEELSKLDSVEENILDELNYIFDSGFEFDEGINIEKIGLIETKKHTYKTVFILEDPINVTKIQELVFGMIYYPSDPHLLELEVDRERGYKKTGVKINIKKMGDNYVFIHDEFKIIPQKHKSIRFYFYNKDGGIVGDELKLYNISFTPINF